MLDMDAFKPVDLADKNFFSKLYNVNPQLHSDYCFSTMVSWKSYMEYFYTNVQNAVVIMTKFDGKIQFRPSVGKTTLEIDKQVIELSIESDSDQPLAMIDSKAKSRLASRFPKLTFEPHRDFFDYEYLATDLVELKGKEYIKIRNMLNRFKKRFEYNVEDITKDNLEEVTAFLNRWCLWKDCDKVPLLSSERDAVFYCTEHFKELGLSGIAIRIQGEIEAISIFEKLNENTGVIHFEKAIPDFDGLYQAINYEAAKILAKDFQFINRESDMGVPGLRMAKTKYRPHHMVEVFHVNKDQLKLAID
jgi:hypothetical protein